ncbi:MAG TPA: hypothetical protein VGP82_11350 [Ktedonobacterales bacterium]|jgi:hypothetical protein|nr:hypothetical protein [Ktedonobacterales bacterium]
MQAPGGADEDTEGGFAQGGWTGPYWHDAIGATFFQHMSESDALLLGRRTDEDFYALWPNRTDNPLHGGAQQHAVVRRVDDAARAAPMAQLHAAQGRRGRGGG